MDVTQEHIDLLRRHLEVIRGMVGPVRRYRAKRNCKKGYNCGGSCITRRKNCRKALEGEARNFSEWLINKMSAEIASALGEAPEEVSPDPIANINPKDYKSLIEGGKAFMADLDFSEDEAILKRLQDEYDGAKAALLEAEDRVIKNRQKNPGMSFKEESQSKEFQEWQQAANELKKKGEALKNPSTPQLDAFKQKIKDYHAAKGYGREQAMADAQRIQTGRFNFGKKGGVGQSLGKQAMKEFQESAAEVFELSGGKCAGSIDYVTRAKDRAWTSDRTEGTSGKSYLNVGKNSPKSTLMHEVAHHIEFQNPDIAQASKDFVKSRATGEPERLRDMVPGSNYSPDEIAYPDKFIAPYVGKVYKDNSSEVVSMGVERLANGKKMRELMEKDPEHFYFIMGVLLS